MSTMLESLAMPAIAEAIEATLNEEMAWFGRALPQGELHKTPEVYWMYTAPDRPNGVLLSRFTGNDEVIIQTKIDEIIQFYAKRKTGFVWTIGPSTRPANMPALLEARGFVYSDSTTGMAVDLRACNENIPVNSALSIAEIPDLDTLKLLRDIEMGGFGASEELAQYYYDTYAHAGFGNSQPWHHYIGWLYDKPVVIASVLYHAGVAGIFGIATIPEARRQGIGATMTLHTLREARKTGYRIAILSPTDMSEAIYRRIGFQDYCTLLHYRSPERK